MENENMSLAEAAQEVQKWGRTIKAFARIDDVVKAAKALDDIAGDLRGGIETLKVEHAQLLSDVASAGSEADRILESAKVQASNIAAAAEASARQASEKAKEERVKQMSEATEIVDRLKQEVEASRVVLSGLTNQRDDMTAEIQDLTGKVAEARAAAARIMGN